MGMFDKGNKLMVLDKGYVEFVDSMGNDLTPANDARISTGSESKSINDDRNLTRYLLRHRHTSPFELVQLKFKVKLPIMVIRELNRHRLLQWVSLNEESARYKKLEPDYYIPSIERIKKQSEFNKQGSGETFDEEFSKEFIENCKGEQDRFESYYNELIIEHNMANELARVNMPISHYSTFIVSGSLLNWFKFLELRKPENVQYETREYANAISDFIKHHYPICYQAFEDYWLNAVTFSADEINLLRMLIFDDKDNYELLEYNAKDYLKGRELKEFLNKITIKKNEE